MSLEKLGKSFDIHGGGTDLIFPHHENEIAQSEAYSGVKPFVRYWLHNGTVNMSGDKMSKSLGNFYTTRELLEQYSADQLRYFIITKHYRSPIEYNEKEIESTNKSLEKLITTKKTMENLLNNEFDSEVNNESDLLETVRKLKHDFLTAMDDDFNTALATGVLHEISTKVNKTINDADFVLSKEIYQQINKVNNIFNELLNILGLKLNDYDNGINSEKFDELVNYVLNLREEARNDKNWELADKIRDDLLDMGIKVNDTPRGTEWEIID